MPTAAEISILIKAKDEASRALQGVNKAAQTLGKVGFLAAAAGATGLAVALKSSVEAAMESQRVETQLNAVLKSTGGIAGVTAEAAKDLAANMQRLTTYDDEAVLSAENVLLTFTKIGKDIFPQATESVLNMSTALGQDLQSSAIQVGKALQDPVLGMTALRRVGVNFSADQVEVVKQMVATGDAAGAQALILKELATEFGGSARAAAETFGGKMAQLKNIIGDIQEKIGMALIPVLQKAATALQTFLVDHQADIERFVKTLGDGLGRIGDVIGPIIARFRDFWNMLDQKDKIVVLSALAGVIGGVLLASMIAFAAASAVAFATNPVTQFALAIGLITVAVTLMVRHWDEIWAAMRAAPANLANWLKGNWPRVLLAILLGPLSIIVMNWKRIWNAAPAPVRAAMNAVAGIVAKAINWIIARLNEVIGALNAFVRGVNNIAGKLKLPKLPEIPEITVRVNFHLADAVKAGTPDFITAVEGLKAASDAKMQAAGDSAGALFGEGLADSIGGAGGDAAKAATADLGEGLAATFTQDLLAGLEGIPPGIAAVISRAGETIETFSASFRPKLEEVFVGVGDLAILGPQVPASYDAAAGALDNFRTVVDYVGIALEAAKVQENVLTTELMSAQAVYDDVAAAVTHYQDQIDAANDSLRRFSGAQLQGTKAFEDASFAIEQAINKIRLQVTNLQLAGAAEEEIAPFRAELERLRLEAEKLDLEHAIQVDPLTKQIRDLLDTTGELSFEDIVAGIKGAQDTLATANPALAYFNELLGTQAEKVDAAKDALAKQSDVVATDTRLHDELTKALGELERVLLAETATALDRYREIVYATEGTRGALIRLEDNIAGVLQPTLNSISTSSAVGQMNALQSAAQNALAAAQAAAAAGGSYLASFQGGIAYVPRNMLALLHQGEMVLPAPVAQTLRRGEAAAVEAPTPRPQVFYIDQVIVQGDPREGLAALGLNV